MEKFRASEAPAHVDVLRHVCAQRGLEERALRGFRCQIDYPVCSSEVVLAFELPVMD